MECRRCRVHQNRQKSNKITLATIYIVNWNQRVIISYISKVVPYQECHMLSYDYTSDIHSQGIHTAHLVSCFYKVISLATYNIDRVQIGVKVCYVIVEIWLLLNNSFFFFPTIPVQLRYSNRGLAWHVACSLLGKTLTQQLHY